MNARYSEKISQHYSSGGIEPKSLIPQQPCWTSGAWSRLLCFPYNTAGVTTSRHLFYPSGCRKVILYCVFYITLHYPNFQNSIIHYYICCECKLEQIISVYISTYLLSVNDCFTLTDKKKKSKSNSFSENMSDVRKITTDTNKYIRFKCKRESSIKLNTCTALFQFFLY